MIFEAGEWNITVEPAVAESGWHLPVPAVALFLEDVEGDGFEMALSSGEAIELARQIYQAAESAAKMMPDPRLN